MFLVLTPCMVVGLCEAVLSGTILFRGSSKIGIMSDLKGRCSTFFWHVGAVDNC